MRLGTVVIFDNPPPPFHLVLTLFSFMGEGGGIIMPLANHMLSRTKHPDNLSPVYIVKFVYFSPKGKDLYL